VLHVTPDGDPGGCISILQGWGYYDQYPAEYQVICVSAYVGGFTNPITAFATCTAAMYAWYVSYTVAGLACHAAV